LAQPELIDQWCREKGMLAFGLRGPDAMVTVMGVLVKPVVPFAALRRDAAIVDIGSLKVPIASIAHQQR